MTSAGLDSVAVIGCGLIGASIAAACADGGVRVYARDIDAANLAQVQSRADVQGWNGEPVDLIVVAVPPAAVVDVIEEISALAPQTPITDVASAKSQIVAAIDSPWFVGGHPLAGSSHSGPAAADGGLFSGRPWVTCARQRANTQARAAVSALIGVCGAHEVQVSADEHDRAVAVTSHAVQMTAAALAVQWAQLPAPAHELHGRAFDEVLRLAGSDPQLWQQIASANAGALSQALLSLADQLTEIADALSVGDSSAVENLIALANEATRTN